MTFSLMSWDLFLGAVIFIVFVTTWTEEGQKINGRHNPYLAVLPRVKFYYYISTP
jgi:DTW domain-containing protein YfiP